MPTTPDPHGSVARGGALDASTTPARGGLRRGALRAIARPSLAVASALVALVVCELGARLLLGPPPFLAGRVLLFSRPPWEDDGGALRFVRNAEIRDVAVYGRHVAYDVSYDTNNLGFIDEADYPIAAPAGARRIAFVGDSFTAGFHGGAPWVPLLRERARLRHPGLVIYNLGVAGTGLVQFESLLQHAAREIAFDEVVVLLITNDLRRPNWRPLEHDGGVYVCLAAQSEEQCLSNGTRLVLLPRPDLPIEDVLAFVEARGLIPESRTLGEWLAQHTWLGSSLAPRPEREPPSDRPRPAWDRGPLQRIRDEFPGRAVRVIHLPEKDEVARGAYAEDISSAVGEEGLVYVPLLGVCPLEASDFLAHDDHPSRSGYEKILACVGAALDLL